MRLGGSCGFAQLAMALSVAHLTVLCHITLSKACQDGLYGMDDFGEN